MGIPTIFIMFLIFVAVFRYHMAKNTNEEKKVNEEFGGEFKAEYVKNWKNVLNKSIKEKCEKFKGINNVIEKKQNLKMKIQGNLVLFYNRSLLIWRDR